MASARAHAGEQQGTGDEVAQRHQLRAGEAADHAVAGGDEVGRVDRDGGEQSEVASSPKWRASAVAGALPVRSSPPCWGQGLASEGMRWMLDELSAGEEIDTVIAEIDVRNYRHQAADARGEREPEGDRGGGLGRDETAREHLRERGQHGGGE